MDQGINGESVHCLKKGSAVFFGGSGLGHECLFERMMAVDEIVVSAV